jgi:hypothetical protein
MTRIGYLAAAAGVLLVAFYLAGLAFDAIT